MKDKTIRHGHYCFRLFYRKIVRISQTDNISMLTAYQRFLESDGWEIAHYFCTAYHLFKYIKDGAAQIETTESQRKRYYELIKSQISQYELVLLWLNVQSINKGNWETILNESEANSFEHLNRANLIENPQPITKEEADA